MNKLSRLMLRNFVPIFIGSLSFFIVLINLSDLFLNIVRYIERNVSVEQILQLQSLYLAQSFVFSLPIALLFSVSFSMGTLYANNELIAVFASGVSLKRFIVPLLACSLFLCLALFYVQDRLSIPQLKERQDISRVIFQSEPTVRDQANVTIQSLGGRIIYQADFFDSELLRLSNVLVVERDDDFQILRQIFADWAEWTEDEWKYYRVQIMERQQDSELRFKIQEVDEFTDPYFNLSPDNFENKFGNVEEMTIAEAEEYIDFLRSAGFPYRKQLTRMYERYSFSLTPIIVTMLSAAIGGRYKKNILGLSLLVSLGISVVYYCLQLFTGLLATVGIVSSFVGAWAGVVITGVAAVILLNKAKT